MAEANAQPYQDDFRAVLLTALFGQIVISQGERDLHEAESTSDE